jgi:hypothetical protein
VLAPHLRALAIEVSKIEGRNAAQAVQLDKLYDFHNDITDWVTNTVHEEAAAEINALLEKCVNPQVRMTLENGEAIMVPEALSPRTSG